MDRLLLQDAGLRRPDRQVGDRALDPHAGDDVRRRRAAGRGARLGRRRLRQRGLSPRRPSKIQTGRLDRHEPDDVDADDRRVPDRWCCRCARSARNRARSTTCSARPPSSTRTRSTTRSKGLSSLMEPFIIVVPGRPDRRHRGLDVPADLQARPGGLTRRRCPSRRASSSRPRPGPARPVHRQLPERRHPPPAADAGARLAGANAPSCSASARAETPRDQPRRRRARAARRAATRSRWYENIPVAQLAVAARHAARRARRRSRRAIRWSSSLTGALFALRRLALRRRSRRRCCGAPSLRSLLALALIDWDTHAAARRPHPAAAVGRPARQRCSGWTIPLPRRGLGRGRRLPVAVVGLLAVQAASPARKAWATATSSCSPRSAPGSAGKMLLPIILLALGRSARSSASRMKLSSAPARRPLRAVRPVPGRRRPGRAVRRPAARARLARLGLSAAAPDRP